MLRFPECPIGYTDLNRDIAAQTGQTAFGKSVAPNFWALWCVTSFPLLSVVSLCRRRATTLPHSLTAGKRFPGYVRNHLSSVLH